MGGGGSPENITQTSKVELPKWYEPYARQAASRAYTQSLAPYQQYPGERIAALTPEQQEGLQGTAERARAAPITSQAQTNIIDTLTGRYLDPGQNPAWQAGQEAITRAYREGVAPSRAAQFSRAGAFGDNSAFLQAQAQGEEALGRSLGGLWGDIYGQERGRQMQALGLTPALSQAGYGDLQNLIGVGDAMRQYQQDVLNLGYQDFLERQQYPWSQLQQFAGLGPALLGNAGTTAATGPNPYRASPLAGAIGGGLLGAGASGLLGMSPALATGASVAGFPYLLPLALGGAALGGMLS